MTYVQWNLDPLEIAELDIYEISIIPEALDKYTSTNDKRLLVLSHSLGYKRIPSFFLQQSPKYIIKQNSQNNQNTNSVVVVFDLYHNFNQNDLFDWCQINHWKWDVASTFQDQLYDDFQRALNVVSYYEFARLKPLYFSSYLLFPQSESSSEPFLYQKIPIRREKTLCIRTSMQGSLDFIIDYGMPPISGSYILIPPHEHPFCVISASDSFMTLRSVEKTTTTVNMATPFVLITRPCVLMSKFFMPNASRNQSTDNDIEGNILISKPPGQFISQPPQQEQDTNIHFFKPVDFHDYTPEDIESFLDELFSDSEKSSTDNCNIQNKMIIEYPEFTIGQIISQMISDSSKKEEIKRCIRNGDLPSTRVNLTMAVSTFLSFFRFDFGFADVKPPFHAQNLMTCSSCRYEKLGIPSVLVNFQGKLKSIPANTVIDQWEEERIQPISGPKSAHFVVFSLSSILPSSVKTFFSQFCNTYNMLNFGALSPLQRDEPFHFLSFEEMPFAIESFFSKNSQTQFQQYPVLSFIVAPPIYNSDFMPHSIISYVRPESILSASEEEMKTLAFVVYSRIRTFNPCPFGMIDIGNHETSILFFGFRYEPPFLLPRQNENLEKNQFMNDIGQSITNSILSDSNDGEKKKDGSMTIHIAWDEATKMSSWIDDTGSILHVLPNTDFKKMNRLINDACLLLSGIEIKFTLSILAEGITNELFKEINDTFGKAMNNFSLFAVSPAPTVQVLFEEQFEDDAVIFAPAEQFLESCNGSDYMKPQSTCYVVAHTLPAYSISLYSNPVWNWKPANDFVFEYAKQMSHLSWLSVKPGSEMRTISYPPHICALLRKTGACVKRVSRYEFLPSLERI
ncbi:hypothetical protein M9Y10_004600 [Tritrichomonas musculus]|uniref:Uncharacterized protein n=1 Tax=Tritrichomonas musculus TaxID=1915356 RepID=A0ABR2JKX4_9EUKA